MTKRTFTLLLGTALALAAAAPAQATLVYVKGAATASPTVYVARDDGSNPRKLGAGYSPVISPNGRWVAWVRTASPDRVILRRADRRGRARRVGTATVVGGLRFSPNSRLLGSVRDRRLLVYDISRRRENRAAFGYLHGFDFGPDSRTLVYGSSGRRPAFDAPVDLYTVERDGGSRKRITRDRRSLNPLWGPDGIVHDRQRWRDGDAPAYNLFEIQPDGGDFRRITRLRIPSLVSGLVPLEVATNGRRLLASFVGQDTNVGFRVNPRSGSVHSLDSDFENGFVATDLTADGETVLGHTGGPDPTGRHNIVTMPYTGGRQELLVRGAMSPHWSR